MEESESEEEGAARPSDSAAVAAEGGRLDEDIRDDDPVRVRVTTAAAEPRGKRQLTPTQASQRKHPSSPEKKKQAKPRGKSSSKPPVPPPARQSARQLAHSSEGGGYTI